MFGLVAPPALSQVVKLDLDGQWAVRQDGPPTPPLAGLPIRAMVPGSIHTDLIAAHMIQDPFYRFNEKEVEWVGEATWTYGHSFMVDASLLAHRHVVLRAEALDTLATISINGREVGHTDNMFRTWEFDAKPFLRVGNNDIKIRFDPVGPVLKAKENQAKFPGKPSWGQGYVRKTPVQNGWDFAPKLLTCGIPRPIGLVAWNDGRLGSPLIEQRHREDRVDLVVTPSVDTDRSDLHVLVVRDVDREEALAMGAPRQKPKGKHLNGYAYPILVKSGKVGQKITVPIYHPKLWWPAGMGEQPLYKISTYLVDSHGRVVDSRKDRVGLRTIVWTPKTDKHPLSVAVNGRPFFVKGANWIPPDALNARVTTSQYRRLIALAKGANMNMLRFWGGGLYEDDSLYDLCDEAGILVWFEFKFACTPYPAFDPDWMADVKQEARDNVLRLRNHPSIAIWSGNNEVGGFVADKTSQFRMSREDYNALFHKELADVVHDLVPGAEYTPGSPESGDEHNWGVWHGGQPFETYRRDHGFMSEFGFQSFPEPRTIDTVTTALDRQSVLSASLKFRQHNIGGHGNENIADTELRYFRKPKDFDSTLWLSQIDQEQGILTGIEHWRRDWPNSSGSLVWQFDDDWPTPSWSMIDYFGRPKALYYGLKKAYAPVAVSGFVNDAGLAEIWVANDLPNQVKGILRFTETDAKGDELGSSAAPFTVEAGTTSVKLASFDPSSLLAKRGRDDLMLWADLISDHQVVSRTLVLFAKPKSLRLVDPKIKYSVASDMHGYRVILRAEHPALWTWVQAGDAKLSDNFIHLRPGEPQSIYIESATKPQIEIKSLYDTFDPNVPLPVLSVRANRDGTIVADAAEGELDGGLVLEKGATPNLGNWASDQDSVEWRVTGVKPGKYRVQLATSSPEGGSRIAILCGDRKLESTVPKTGDWNNYVNVDQGEIELKGGTTRLAIRVVSMKGDHVMNLRSMTLTPVAN